MNNVVLMGRLTKDPETRYTQEGLAVSRYTLAVDRRKQGETDFIRCVAFGKGGEFAEKNLRKGKKIAITGRIQTGSYTNKDGQTVYTTEVVVVDHEFVESKKAEEQNKEPEGDGFVAVPEGIDEELPFA